MFDPSPNSSVDDETIETVRVLDSTTSLMDGPTSRPQRTSYERRFADFLFLLRATREELITVHHPQVLGDNYDEIVESLHRLGDAGKRLAVVPRSERI